ncbi:hypothetical protein BsWGS_18311 [Bradybaena similaris]
MSKFWYCTPPYNWFGHLERERKALQHSFWEDGTGFGEKSISSLNSTDSPSEGSDILTSQQTQKSGLKYSRSTQTKQPTGANLKTTPANILGSKNGRHYNDHITHRAPICPKP